MSRQWVGQIGCEGGPVLVANATDFEQWYGSDALPADSRNELHFWSPFTGELPARFQPQGATGHQYLPSQAPAELREQLIAEVLALWPDTQVDRSADTWVATRPDGRKLQAVLEPSSEYSMATRELGFEAVYRYASGASCFLWSIEPGLVRIVIDESREQLHLAQIHFADTEPDAETAHAHALNEAGEPSELQYRISTGPVVALWAPQSIRDLPPNAHFRCGPAEAPHVLDLAMPASGAAFWLEPGDYQPFTGYRESPTWGVNWCTLRRCAAQQ